MFYDPLNSIILSKLYFPYTQQHYLPTANFILIMRKLYLLCFATLIGQLTFAQDFSNKGKEFWLVFPAHTPSSAQAQMGLFITSDRNSSGTITVNGFSTTFTVAANQVTGPINIPYANANIGNSGAVVNKGIHVVVTPGQPPVVLYAHIYAGFRSEASLILPVTTLGKKYYSTNFYQASTAGSQSQFNVVATEANTVVQYKLRINGNLSATPITVNLPNPGDQVQVQNSGDLSGSIIESIASGTGSCKRIAVFSGSSALAIGRQGCNGGSYDPLFQQCYPTTTWGKNFGVVPLLNNTFGFHIRVMASEDNTVINVNGTTVTLNAGQYYPATTINPVPYTVPLTITGNKPICVSQYLMSAACAGSATFPMETNPQGDPDMIILNPVEQNISDINIFSSNLQNIHTKYLNVYMKTAQSPSFRINGAVPNASFVPMPQNNGYSYLQEDISGSLSLSNSYRLTADSGFNAITYGMGDAESYGYSAGTNVKDLYQQIGVYSQYGIETTPSVCTGSPFKFKISLPYRPDSIYWDLTPEHPGAWILPVAPADTLAYDSTTFINGKQVYWYSLPTYYTYNAIGTYPITITTYTANSEGCGNQQEIDFELEVSNPPSAEFNFVTPRCVAETVQFTDNSNTVKPTYRWWWDFGDPGSGAANNTSALKNPTHLFSAPGTYSVRYANITTPGCLSDTIVHSIVIAALPSGTISGGTTVCRNGTSPTITFTGAGGSAPYTFTYTINNGTPATVTTTAGNSATIAAPTNTVGNFVYTLTNIQNTGSALCVRTQNVLTTVIVSPLPLATISGTATVCQTGTAPNITFTGSGASAPYTFTYNINGGAPLTVTTTSGNSVAVSAPTAITGTFTYNLVNVSTGAANACTQAATGSAIITINPLPTATATGTASVCRNGTAPTVTFTGSGGTAPYTFTYNINGGTNQTVVSTVGNAATLTAPTGTVGTFVYNLINVKDASTSLCTNAVTGQTVAITVRPLPAATISGTTAVCEGANSPDITFTGNGSTAPYTFTYTINGGIPATVTGTGNTALVAVPTTTPGNYIYSLTSVADASSNACSSSITGASSTVIVRPLPTATISGTATVCQNATAPAVTFTGAAGTLPYTFTYNINGDAATQTISTTGSNSSVSITVPAGTVGSTVYNLMSVTDASANLCSRNVTGAATITVNALPTAGISVNTTELCLNGISPVITFTGAGGSAPYRFTYKINGGASQFISTGATSNTVTLNVPTGVAGTFLYTLTNVSEGSANLCTQSINGASVSILVNPLPTANFVASVPSCANSTIGFNPASSSANAGAITNYAWNFGDAGSANNTSALINPQHTYSAAGNYTVTLTVTTDKGCISAVTQKTVVVNPLPSAGFVLPEVCLLDPFAAFTDTSRIAAPGTITGWEWNFGDAANSTPGNPNTSTVQNPQHKYTLVGNYTVRLIAISNNGCRDTATQSLTINGGNPIADFLPSVTANYCANDSVVLYNRSAIASGNITKLEVIWDNANAPTVIEQDNDPVFDKVYKHKYPDFQSPATKQFDIRVRAYSGGVCFSDKIRTITLNASPKVVFDPIPNGCSAVAPYLITQAHQTGPVTGTGVYSGAGIVPVSPGVYNFSPSLAGEGTHTIKYVFTSTSGCIDSASSTVTVFANPTVNAGADVTILQGGSITLQPIATGTNLQYLWLDNRFLNNNTIRTPLASPTEDITYVLTVTGTGGCTASDNILVKVLLAPKIPNTFSPNNDGINDLWKIEYLDTYPACKVQVFTRTGKLVFESRGYRKPWDGNMNGKSLPVDTYYYIIEPESGRQPITGYITIIK